jgi:hypothetical protein
MAKKPQKEVFDEVIKNLVQSEITGIQIVAQDMAERVKKLEEHSIRIKKYAGEIEKLAADAATEKYDKESLDELVSHLEQTLAQLRKKQTGGGEAKTESTKVKTSVPLPPAHKKVVVAVEPRKAPAPEPKKVAVAEKPVVQNPPVVQKPPVVLKPPVMPKTEEIVPSVGTNRKVIVYTTPEGFLVRKIRI